MSAIFSPESFLKARETVEKIVGNDVIRLPNLADLPQMSYISVTIKELLRWRPPVPVIPQHLLTEDLDFEGYHFLAGE